MRGLKSSHPLRVLYYKMVAPFMGAWIEIKEVSYSEGEIVKSHPLWVRGLKLQKGMVYCIGCSVAPFMGAWIEIE